MASTLILFKFMESLDMPTREEELKEAVKYDRCEEVARILAANPGLCVSCDFLETAAMEGYPEMFEQLMLHVPRGDYQEILVGTVRHVMHKGMHKGHEQIFRSLFSKAGDECREKLRKVCVCSPYLGSHESEDVVSFLGDELGIFS